MGIGASIFLIAIGAIVAFGVNYQLSWLDLSVVGWVLMLSGSTGLVLTVYFWNRRRQASTTVEERRYYNGRSTPPPPAQTEVRERRYSTGAPPRRTGEWFLTGYPMCTALPGLGLRSPSREECHGHRRKYLLDRYRCDHRFRGQEGPELARSRRGRLGADALRRHRADPDDQLLGDPASPYQRGRTV